VVQLGGGHVQGVEHLELLPGHEGLCRLPPWHLLDRCEKLLCFVCCYCNI
jgi:hypothetical protein